jgi:hypothetical protein
MFPTAYRACRQAKQSFVRRPRQAQTIEKVVFPPRSRRPAVHFYSPFVGLSLKLSIGYKAFRGQCLKRQANKNRTLGKVGTHGRRAGGNFKTSG